MRCDEYGIKLIGVSSHMGARPKCAPYQGKIYSRDGSGGVTTDGQGNKIYFTPLSETSYGEPDGLFGINCGHVQYPFVPGCSFQQYFPYPEEENAERYRQLQRQRYMERQIRASKRECMMFDETGDEEGFSKASARLKNKQRQYEDYCKDTGLKQHNDRTQVLGVDRSVSSKAAWENRKAQGSAPVPQEGQVMYKMPPNVLQQQLSQNLTNNQSSDKIPLNQLNTKVKKSKQREHILGNKRWTEECRKALARGDNPNSFLYKTIDAQKLVDELSGKGNLVYLPGRKYPIEYVDTKEIVGKSFDKRHGKYVETRRICIVYSSKGVHVYPVNN